MVVRMNFGSGSIQPEGWVNVDREVGLLAKDEEAPGFRQVDIRDGLPWGADHFDYIVADHSLSDLTHHELGPALAELYRVLKPGGVLRVAVPDLLGAVDALRHNQPEWFPQGDDLENLHERFCTYVTWFGTVGSVFTPPYLRLLLERAGFRDVLAVECNKTHCSDPGILELDSRCSEALIMEGVK